MAVCRKRGVKEVRCAVDSWAQVWLNAGSELCSSNGCVLRGRRAGSEVCSSNCCVLRGRRAQLIAVCWE
jgi:hypothetical protein